MQDVARNAAHPYSAGLLAARFDLDSDRRRPLPTLPPERTPSINVENACAYATRCPIAQSDCMAIRPPLRPHSAHGGAVACLHAEQTPSLTVQRADAKPWPAQAIQETAALRLSNIGKSISDRHPIVLGTASAAARSQIGQPLDQAWRVRGPGGRERRRQVDPSEDCCRARRVPESGTVTRRRQASSAGRVPGPGGGADPVAHHRRADRRATAGRFAGQ